MEGDVFGDKDRLPKITKNSQGRLAAMANMHLGNFCFYPCFKNYFILVDIYKAISKSL